MTAPALTHLAPRATFLAHLERLRILRELSHDPDLQVRGMARRLLAHEEGR